MSANKNRYSLDKGFLFLKQWARLMRQLPPEDFCTVFWEVYDYQDSRGEKTIPSHADNDFVQGLIDMILPTIESRLDGAKRNPKETNEDTPTIPPYDTPLPDHPNTAKLSKVKLSKVKLSKDNVSAKADKDIYEKEFESLWEKYPKKQGKSKALQSYIKARKQGTPFEDVERGLNAYLKQIDVLKTTPQFIKHGSTWFNQCAWDDEYSTEQGGVTYEKHSGSDERIDEEQYGETF